MNWRRSVLLSPRSALLSPNLSHQRRQCSTRSNLARSAVAVAVQPKISMVKISPLVVRQRAGVHVLAA